MPLRRAGADFDDDVAAGGGGDGDGVLIRHDPLADLAGSPGMYEFAWDAGCFGCRWENRSACRMLDRCRRSIRVFQNCE